MIEWAINGVARLAQEVDNAYALRHHNLIGTLEQMRDNHSVSWFRTFAGRLAYIVNRHPQEDWHIALSEFQLLSKFRSQALLNQHCTPGSDVSYQGSWLGLGPLMMLTQNPTLTVTGYDLDGPANYVSNRLCNDPEWTYNALLADITSPVITKQDHFNIYVNLITEHLIDVRLWRQHLPAGKIVLASNCDLPESDHASTCSSMLEFLDQLGVILPMATDTVTCYRADGSAMNRWIVLFST
jgi:hypothetical protein